MFQSSRTAETIILFFLIAFLGVNALLNAFFGFSFVLFLGTVPLAALLAFFFPRAGFVAALLITLLFERFFTLQPIAFGESVYKLYPLDIILVSVFVSSFLLYLKEGRKMFRFRMVDAWLVGFFAFVSTLFLVSLGGSSDTSLSVAFSTWKNYVFYGLIVFFLGGMLRSKEDLQSFMKLFFMGLLFVSVFLFIGLVRGGGLWTEYTPLSTAGTRFLAFPHAFYFSLGLIILLLSLPYWSGKERKSKVLFLILLSVIFIAGIIGSLMRHLWLGLGATLLAALIASPFVFGRALIRYIRTFIFPVFFIAVSFSLFLFILPSSDTASSFQQGVAVVKERVTSIGNEYDESFAWRGKVWESTLQRFKENPWLGIGFGVSVPVELGEYRQYVEVRNMHNSWLALLVQTGIVGAVILLFYLLSLFIALWRLPLGDEFLRQGRFVLSGLLIFQGLVFFSQPYLETNLLGIFFWTTLGIIRSLIEWNISRSPYAHS